MLGEWLEVPSKPPPTSVMEIWPPLPVSPGLVFPLSLSTPSVLQYSCLGNSTERGAWWATAHASAESDMTERLSGHTLKLHCQEQATFRIRLGGKQIHDP